MIGYLKGKVILENDGEIVLDVNGVGYRVFIGSGFSNGANELELFIYTSVSERAFNLYGFLTVEDLKVFELLLGVSGIGPKKAMGVLSKVPGDDLLSYISLDQPESIQSVGISKKIAEKIIIELKSKVDKMKIVHNSTVDISGMDKTVYIDVIEALSALGYKKYEIDTALGQINIDKDTKTEVVVKDLLNLLR